MLAPADGVVTFVLKGRPDLPIGEADPYFHAGNQIVMDISGGHLLMMGGHLREGSIQVRVGDHVTEGQQIALVGNSGNSSAPHIHIQAQTLPIGIGDIRRSISQQWRGPCTPISCCSAMPRSSETVSSPGRRWSTRGGATSSARPAEI